MQRVDEKLVICGVGDALDTLKELTYKLGVSEKVSFMGFISPDKLLSITQGAKMGFTLFTKGGMSHWHSMANRFFDYFHAGIPQIAMNYPEYKAFNDRYKVALLIDDIEPKTIATAIQTLLSNKKRYTQFVHNTKIARNQVNWQTQEKVLLSAYASVIT